MNRNAAQSQQKEAGKAWFWQYGMLMDEEQQDNLSLTNERA
jgi:hypothetical protein